MSFRKEKKYRLSYFETLEIKKILNKKGMLKLHPRRIINSCYFDNEKFELFSDSEEGLLPRKKVRIRWYENNLDFKKEIKISSIEGRFKTSNKIEHLKSVEDLKKIKFFENDYGQLFPVMIVSYLREYYSLKNLRITIDTKIKYIDLRLKTEPALNDNECVVEIKTPLDYKDDYIEKIFYYPTSRFSKYSRGLLHHDKMM